MTIDGATFCVWIETGDTSIGKERHVRLRAAHDVLITVSHESRQILSISDLPYPV